MFKFYLTPPANLGLLQNRSFENQDKNNNMQLHFFKADFEETQNPSDRQT